MYGLLFKLGIGIVVYGTLNILGEENHPVILEADQSSTPYKMRLKGGSHPWEGVVQIKKDNKWLSVCSNSSYDSDIKTRISFVAP